MGRAEGIFSGRERELERVGSLFDTAKSGSAVAMIEGAPGIGKTALLAHIADMAAERGFTIMEFSDLEIPTERRPAVTFSVRSPITSVTIEVVGLKPLQRHIEAQTVHGPLLIVCDDLQAARQCAIRALSSLLRRFRDWPVLWTLAARPAPGLAGFIDRIGDWPGPVYFTDLDRLPDEAVAELVERLVDARPDPGLMELVSHAEGRPFLVTALVSGMLDERTVEVSPDSGTGVTRVVSPKLPVRLVRAVQRHVDELSPRSRQLVTVAASLGQAFALDDVAGVLGARPGRLLGELDEAVRHGVLTSRDRRVTFTSELFRRAISDGVPHTASTAPTPPVPTPDGVGPIELTDVERRIVALVGRGMTNVQIAHRLVKSEHTVNYHLQKIYRRFNVHSRAELISRLQRRAAG